jgi:hypothetical protein
LVGDVDMNGQILNDNSQFNLKNYLCEDYYL